MGGNAERFLAAVIEAMRRSPSPPFNALRRSVRRPAAPLEPGLPNAQQVPCRSLKCLIRQA